ncbi:methylglyoxal synthase [Alkaliphilus hydrothermalis]|uniref:Methylglyoxal synthase n=1 Tax=Alkaliphilus hydrothermalis TaxID=1482730 RepID=A0ABS2NKX0_9FIRM|nr:methylglyoxal synthase [Alkaliphilus hydrothermalis]MBM7613585.1 methylglyoxal synthase [Alkaliphilus hydrothermalis]
MNLALIAHDKKKETLVNFAIAYENILKKHNLFATGTTGKRIMEATSLEIHCFKSGPLGGDQQIGSAIANNHMDMVIFLRDPMTAQPHEPDIQALIRLCDVYMIPVATNIATGEILLKALERGDLEWRNFVKENNE